MNKINFDGFFFTPGEYEDELQLSFFEFQKKKDRGEKIEHTQLGDKYHIAFFKMNEKGVLEFDESFEAIFADPLVYVKNLVGGRLGGCVLRKTTKSTKWFKNYLKKTKEDVMMNKDSDIKTKQE
jgi:hypothetical protein